jgi:hypothetical protein
LQEEGGLADAGIAANQNQGAGNKTAAENPIELSIAGTPALFIAIADLGKGDRSATLGRRFGHCGGATDALTRAPAGLGFNNLLFYQRVENPAGRAFPKPLAGFAPTLTAHIDRSGLLGHN